MQATGKIIDQAREELNKGFKQPASGRTALQGGADDYVVSFEPQIAKCTAAFERNREALKEQA